MFGRVGRGWWKAVGWMLARPAGWDKMGIQAGLARAYVRKETRQKHARPASFAPHEHALPVAAVWAIIEAGNKHV